MIEKGQHISDEMLVAFIDGELNDADCSTVESCVELNPDVAARLHFLRAGDLPFAAAFDGLLAQAPTGRLEAMVIRSPSSRNGHDTPRIDRRWFLAAACLIGGVALDQSVGLMTSEGASSDQNWRDVVANYMALYSPETLDGLAPGPAPGEHEMARLSALLGVDVDLAKVELPGIAMRRAQLLTYQGAPLAQIAYSDPATGPMAFCFLRRAGRAEQVRTERRFGMALAYWSSSTHAFLVVGHASGADIKSAAERIGKNLET